MDKHQKSVAHFRTATLKFVRAELEVAAMFADVAVQADDHEKILRNRQMARQRHDVVVRFLAAVALTPAEETKIGEQMGLLRSAPVELGEDFGFPGETIM